MEETIETTAFDEELREKRQNGYLPMKPPIYRKLWRCRTNAMPTFSTVQMCSTPKRKASKNKRGLKTPRLMLPIFLG